MCEEVKEGGGEYCSLWDTVVKGKTFRCDVFMHCLCFPVSEKVCEPFFVIVIKVGV